MKALFVAGLAVCTVGVGCSSVERFEAVRDAVQDGLVDGLSASNHMDSIVGSFPSIPSGHYSKLRSLTGTTTDNPTNEQTYVFFLGKSRETKNGRCSRGWFGAEAGGRWFPSP